MERIVFGMPGNVSRFATRRNVLVIGLICLLAGIGVTGCATASNTKETPWLTDLSNPFLGKWQSDIPSAGLTLIFDYKTDGTFDYEMVGVPAEQGGIGTGGYVVFDNMMVTWLDFEGAAVYTFEVADNDTINVTELEPDENGHRVPGSTTPFTHVKGSDVNTENVPFKLSNAFIGKWQLDVPSVEGMSMFFSFNADGSFDFDTLGVPEEQAGKGSGWYIVYGNKRVIYMESDGAFKYDGVGVFKFEIVDADTISITELFPDENGELVPGDTAPYTRVK
jgi:hypothetical protein